MGEMEMDKALITVFNIAILISLPIWCVWHAARIRKFEHWSFEWWSQIIIVITYIGAINAEIPAFLARLYAYYIIHMQIPKEVYVYSTWDRWGHTLFYALFILLTWIFSKKRMPEYVKEVLT